MSNLDQIQAAADALRTLTPKDRDRALSLATSDLPGSPGAYHVQLSYGPATIARVGFVSGDRQRILQVTKCLALPDVEGPWQVNQPLFARWGPRISEWDPAAPDLSKTELVYHPPGNASDSAELTRRAAAHRLVDEIADHLESRFDLDFGNVNDIDDGAEIKAAWVALALEYMGNSSES